MMAGVSNISLFAPQMADIERQRQMAEMLQQQANAPIEIQSYRGIQAPIPTTAVLAKALQGFAAARRRGQADTAERILRQKEEDIRKSEAEAVARAYETGEFVPPKVDKTAPEMPSAPESRAMQIAKALGLGGVANRMRGLVPGQQPVAPQDPNVPNFAGIPYAQGPEAPPSVAPPVAPPMAMPAIGAYNPQSGFGLSGIAPSPAAMPPVAPAVAAPPVAPPVAARPVPTQLDREIAAARQQTLSRDPSIAAAAQQRVMQLEGQRSARAAISGAVSGTPDADKLTALINAGIDPGEATGILNSVKPQRSQLHFFQSGRNVVALDDNGDVVSVTEMDMPTGASALTADERRGYGIGPNVPAYKDENGNPHILNIPQPKAASGASRPAQSDDLSGLEAALKARGLL
jgi:hypothetical protein